MKINLGHGAYLEPDEPPRNSRFHKRILRVSKIAYATGGHFLDLECGHRIMSFGRLIHAGGVVLCTQCREKAQ
jgi:hypothetical protein